MGLATSFRQNGENLVITEIAYDRQLRKIRNRDARKEKKILLKKVEALETRLHKQSLEKEANQ
jgi:hypothetical protein